ncbi:unnamed protein product [Dibothriocephalus latus]|uniref:Receptor ligand binding region domain-containing protein n=1 Tax=Dibothriocephalus latus TaxID=60516 RepID=A0A3P6UGK0_DIBLA|nr:unnamed protein product [Dibothriocephalus latus]
MKSSVLLSVFLFLLCQYYCSVELPLGPKLRLVFVLPSNHCLIENQVFDVVQSMWAAVRYSTKRTNGLIRPADVGILVHVIPGCSLLEENQVANIAEFLQQLGPQVEALEGYTVYIGPTPGSTCALINDWVAQSKLVQAAYGSLRQIDYACVADSLVRYYAKTAPRKSAPGMRYNLSAVTIGIPNEGLYRPLHSFLRQRGWRNIAILYERSTLALQNAGVSETIAFLITHANGDEENMNVFFTGSFQWGMKDMPIIQKGQVAIVIFDSGNVLTYDIMRLYKLMLGKEPNLGAAAQSTFLMTGLPSTSVYDIGSKLLNSNISVPVAIATGMAVGLTYLNLKANDNTIPEETDFFSTIMCGIEKFPILPNLTLYFGREDSNFIMPYDYYFLGFSENVTQNNVSVIGANFDEIFILHSILLWPRDSLDDIEIKVWPGGSSGPEADHCLQSLCYTGNFELGLLSPIQIALVTSTLLTIFVIGCFFE